MGGVFLRWGIPGFVTVVGGTAISIVMTGENIASDLTTRTSNALAGAEYAWASVSFDSRDAIITGTATDQKMIDDVAARVASVHGVRAVTTNVVLAGRVSPYPFAARIDADGIELAGGVPDEAARAAIVARTAAAGDGLRLMSGAPQRNSWDAAIEYGLSYLELFDEGEVRLADLELSVSGRAKSREAYEELATLSRLEAPKGVRIASLELDPPLASPYEWRASFDGTLVTISGHAPTEELAARLQNAELGGVPVSASLVLASGAPAEFDRNALLLLTNLVRLEQGIGTISDGKLSLTGAPPDEATAASIKLAMTPAGASVTLDPPRVAEYEFTASRDGETIRLDGFVPDAATRDRLEALEDVDATGLELARGAPDRFGSAVDFALEALARMSEGRAHIRGTVISLEGRAITLADFTALETSIALGAPQGLILARADIRPPRVAPFVWSAEKIADGTIAIAGFVPSLELRNSLQAAIPDIGSDQSVLADGSPADFDRLAPAALDVLQLLDTGKVEFDGKAWSIIGAVDTPQKGFAAEAAFAAAGLREAGWGYAVALPEPPATVALPVVDPYVWRAQKSADGQVRLDGYVPAEAARKFFAGRAGEGAIDNTQLASGAPDGFIPAALAGLDALAQLDEGVVGFAAGIWSLSGETATTEARLAVEEALTAAVDTAGWQIAIEANNAAAHAEETAASDAEPGPGATAAVGETEAAADEEGESGSEVEVAVAPSPPATPDAIAEEPAATPPAPRNFVFVANKSLDGPVSFDGVVPAEPTKRWFGVIAGQVPTDSLEVGTGLPADFIPNADAGVRALAMLADGQFGLDGDRWVLTGRTETEAERTAALAALDALPSTAGWEIDVALLPPIEICRRKVTAFATRNAILFQSGSARMTEESAPALDELASYLAICPEATVHVEGHTDADGADDLNLVLSVARAEAVANALIARGVRAERLYAIGYGESLPIADNETRAGKQANRRIVFTILDEHI